MAIMNQKGWGVRFPAPAKLNLMLRIVGRRADGYHLLQTVFQFIELCDWLSFEPSDDGLVKLAQTLDGVAEDSDLTVRAAKLLKAETGFKAGVTISVEKNLPMGGGLGGGSSDAATTLVVLNHLWNLGLSTEKLMQLGLSLGADVPIFVHGHAAWAEGVGEQVQDIDVPELWTVVIKPDCHVNTGEIFSAKELTRDSKPIRMRDFIAGQHQNDCVTVVSQRYSAVKQALVELSEFSEARLTGTGACVFAQFDSKESAQLAFDKLKYQWQVYLTKGINQSPLLTQLQTNGYMS